MGRLEPAGRLDVEAGVRDLIRRRVSLSTCSTDMIGVALPGDLSDDLRLGSGGVGLDSIALVELLIDCGERFAVSPPVVLLEGGPLTVGRLVAGLRAAKGQAEI